MPLNGHECEYFIVGDKIPHKDILLNSDDDDIPSIKNNLSFDNNRIWIKRPVLHAGLARFLTKRNLAYNHNLRTNIHSLKCVFIIMNENMTSGGVNCYDMKDANKPAANASDCEIELAVEYMEAINIKVIIKSEFEGDRASESLHQLSHKMPVITYNQAEKTFFQICRSKKVVIPSIKNMESPWKVCPHRLKDQESIPIIKG